MNAKHVMVLCFLFILLIESVLVQPVLSQPNGILENISKDYNTDFDLSVSEIQFVENTSMVTIYAKSRGNISNTSINEVALEIGVAGYNVNINDVSNISLNESMKYSRNVPEIYGKMNITAHINPLSEINETDTANNELTVLITRNNTTLINGKKTLMQYTFIINMGLVFLILSGFSKALIKRDL